MTDEIVESTPELDSTPLESTAEVDSTPNEVETDETDLTADADPAEGESAAGPTDEPDAPLVAGQKLSEKAKAHLTALKATDPKLAAQLKSALFSADAFGKAFPGGMKEAQQIKEVLTSVGGPEGIQALKSDLQTWDEIDQRFTAADPRFVEEIAEASPESFAKLAPAIFAKYSELAPEGYGAYVSQVFVADMQQSQIPLLMARLSDHLGDNPKAQELYNQLAGYFNRIDKLSKQEVKLPAAKQAEPKLDEERQSFLKEKDQFTRERWGTAVDADRVKVFSGEWARQTKDLKISDTQAAAVKELYISRLQNALKKTPEFNETLEKYFKAGDQPGYLKFINSTLKKEIPNALRAAIDAVMPARKPGPKAGAPATSAPARAATQAAPVGYARIAARPATANVDYDRTSPSMILQGKAVLIDGKKVQWKV